MCARYKFLGHAHSSIDPLTIQHVQATPAEPRDPNPAITILHFDHPEVYSDDWQCWECKIHHSQRDAFEPWRTFDGISQSLVCEDCISRQFDQALDGPDVQWPARWGNKELDPHHFASPLARLHQSISRKRSRNRRTPQDLPTRDTRGSEDRRRLSNVSQVQVLRLSRQRLHERSLPGSRQFLLSMWHGSQGHRSVGYDRPLEWAGWVQKNGQS